MTLYHKLQQILGGYKKEYTLQQYNIILSIHQFCHLHILQISSLPVDGGAKVPTYDCMAKLAIGLMIHSTKTNLFQEEKVSTVDWC